MLTVSFHFDGSRAAPDPLFGPPVITDETVNFSSCSAIGILIAVSSILSPHAPQRS